MVACNNNTSHSTAKEEVKMLSPDELNAAIAAETKLKIDSIGILLYDGFFELDAIGPFQVLKGLVGTKVFFVAEKTGIIKGGSGLQITVERGIESVDQLDILLIPGGTKGTVAASKNENILAWIKKIDKNSQFTTSVCTGAWILGEAGLLANKKATTNWYRAKEKLAKYNARFIEERWVQDGKYWTSAGVSAGIDMSLALVAAIKGETYAKMIMLNLEYDPQPPFEGGSVQKTSEGIINYMTVMYDGILK